MSIEADSDQVQKKMHDAISSLIRATAANDAILDQLFSRVVALERSAVARKLDDEQST